MSRLSLQSKAFITLSILLAVMMLLFVGFSRVGLQRGLGPYVAEIELERMDWLAYRLQVVYKQSNNDWQNLREQPTLWRAIRRPPGGWLRPDEFDPRNGASTLFPSAPAPLPPASTRAAAGSSRSSKPSSALGSPLNTAAAPSPAETDAPPAGLGHPTDALARRLCVLDADQRLIVGNEPQAGAARTALKDDVGRTIGYLVMNPPQGLEREADRAFLEKQLGFVIWTGAAGIVLALLLSGWLAHRWLKPIGALVSGAKNLAEGRLQTRVPEQANSEEFSRLIQTFNHMAEQLDSTETSRRQWIGDMAHELRTPLAAMRAEVEALQDGIRSFDEQTAARLHRQLMRMISLVGDLRTSVDSSNSTPTRMEPMLPTAQITEAIASMQTRFDQGGVGIHYDEPTDWTNSPANAPRVRGNAQQLHRVFLNLLENSLRYTDRGGVLQVSTSIARVRSSQGQQQLLFCAVFDDTAPGVSAQEMPHIFERLYRTESSRQRALGDLGGSGLGLAICRAIVQAHGGTISAAASPLGGLRISVSLPLLDNQET